MGKTIRTKQMGIKIWREIRKRSGDKIINEEVNVNNLVFLLSLFPKGP